METEVITSLLQNTEITVNPLEFSTILGIALILVLIIFSALISGSETAFFSLTPRQIKEIKESDNKKVISLLEYPDKLLATILISNNFVNIAIVILSTYITSVIFNFSNSPVLGFIFQIVIVTFLLLLFGEIIPKVYASQYAKRFSMFMSYPLTILTKLFHPVSYLLTNTTSFFDKRLHKKDNISLGELSQAIELASEDISDEKNILEGIVKFSNISCEDIMTPRISVIALDIRKDFTEVKEAIVNSGFSRLPVYNGNFDNIKGILYVKDLLPHLNKQKTFKWQSLIRPPYFVPKSKKISDLLENFQQKKIHLAFVVDEYGGCSGIITMEDIMEEIVGEISDELDENEIMYTIDKKGAYIFEANILLNDFFKITGVDDNIFNNIKGEADTLAGLILEIKGEIPEIKEEISYRNYKFTILGVDNRRIKKIQFEQLTEAEK